MSHVMKATLPFKYDILIEVSGQFLTRKIPHNIGPDEWFSWLVVVLVGNSPRDLGPGGQ